MLLIKILRKNRLNSIILFFNIIMLFYNSNILSQEGNIYRPEDSYEVKLGIEVYRTVPILGFGRNYYISNYVSLSPELLLIGAPTLVGTFRITLPLTKSFEFTPHAGFGLTPVGFLISSTGILGVNISYKINRRVEVFIESRIFYFKNDLISIGKGFFGIDDLKKNKPIILTMGVSF